MRKSDADEPMAPLQASQRERNPIQARRTRFVSWTETVLRSGLAKRQEPSFLPGLPLPKAYGSSSGPLQAMRLDTVLQVLVRDNNVDQALRVLKKKMQREGVFREMKQRKAYEKPSERKTREKAEAVRRSRKAARKQAIREGLIAAPKPKPRFPGPRRPSTALNTGVRVPATEPKVLQDQQ